MISVRQLIESDTILKNKTNLIENHKDLLENHSRSSIYEQKFQETILKQQDIILQQQTQILSLQQDNDYLRNNRKIMISNDSQTEELNSRILNLQQQISRIEIEKECLFEIIKNIQEKNQNQAIIVSLSKDTDLNFNGNNLSNDLQVRNQLIEDKNVNPSVLKNNTNYNDYIVDNPQANFEKTESMKSVINELNFRFKEASTSKNIID